MASESDSGNEFEVGQIMQQRKRRGVLEYLVRWKGFGPEEDSWETGKNLSHAQHLLDEFTKPITKTKTTKRTSRRASSSRSRSRSRSRGRSSSRSRNTGVKSSTPARKGTKTEVVRKTQTSKIPGGYERTTEVIRKTTARPEIEVKSRTPLRLQGEETTKTVYEHRTQTVRSSTGALPRSEALSATMARIESRQESARQESFRQETSRVEQKKPMSMFRRCMQSSNSDFPTAILFAVMIVIILSFVLEEYVDFGAVWEWLVAMAILIVAWVKGLFGA
ncbi:hypothetical protein ScPMuIL_001023 [Solemya velum]